ncbi:glycerol-3-phosphate dehydrogenase/oxidase [Sphaerimonospora cavernae]|uniref:Glycerol-3-phosphate dehydrogenase/oxidase n=1 Tax=Sphaerimonospora cavernae TaxID=1740611 RepID=A0ABV6TZJ2_9ACTN
MTDSLPTSVELLVVGGGINGLAITRDAAARGLDVLLIERDDLGAETSNWSSRMIHGGLRYLEQLDLALVHESLRERETLFQRAPHLVKPMDLVIPVFEDSTRNRVVITAGMVLYDLLSWRKSVSWFRPMSRRATIAKVPGLRRQGLKGAVRYTDGQVELSERLCVELALDAIRLGARVVTHRSVTGLENASDGVRAMLSDGSKVTASVVVNAAGPWVDEVLGGSGRRLIGGTRGSHIALARFEGAPTKTVHFETEDGKPLLVIPWRGVLLIGSTDHLDDSPDRKPAVSPEERALLVRQVNRLFPAARITEDDILFEYCGVRPLPYVEGKAATAITRRHYLHAHSEFNNQVISVIGGKLTTHRSLAEEAVNAVQQRLGPVTPCATTLLPFPGATTPTRVEHELAAWADLGVAPEVAQSVVDRYGALSASVRSVVAEDKALAEPIDDAFVRGEVVHAVHRELAGSLADVVLRRMVVRFDLVSEDLVDEVVKTLVEHCGWDDTRVAADRAELIAALTRVGVHTLTAATKE